MSQPIVYDIAITGGGLAGLCLAIQSAKAGHQVILFEKEIYPFHKVCGEYISLESHDFLQGLGVPFESWNLPIIKKLNISDVKGRMYSFNLPLGGFGVSRYKLDEFLYQQALQSGVNIFTDTRVNDIEFANNLFTITTTAGVYSAKIAAGSFGKRSNLDVKWKRPFTVAKPNKLNNYIGIKYHIKTDAPADIISLHNFENGYCGFSKIENDTYCLCYLTTADNLKKSGQSVSRMEADILGKNPNLKALFSNAEFVYAAPLAISQISFSKKTKVENHILLLGDAAGMITPLCGNGMSMAMHGSKLVFGNVHLFLQAKIT